VRAQSTDSTAGKLANIPSRLLTRIQSKTASLNQQLTSQTQKYLQQMSQQEQQLQKKMSGVDSNGAKSLFANSAQHYAMLSNRLKNDTGSQSMKLSGPYHAYTDSLRGALAFLRQNPQLIQGSTPATTPTLPGVSALPGATTLQSASSSLTGSTNGISSAVQNTSSKLTSATTAAISPKAHAVQAQLQKATSQLQALQAKMQDAAIIQQYIQQRQARIQQYLSKYSNLPSGVTNTFNGYNTKAAYYTQQVNSYKDMLDDPDKMFTTALAVLNKVPAFSNFMKSHSMLSSLSPGGGSAPTSNAAQAGQGLPSRDQVLSGIQGQMGKGGPSASSLSQQSTGSAMGMVSSMESKLSGLGSGGGNMTMPTNPQKTQPFLHRLEFGINLQSTPSSYFFPATTDIGVSLGYKLNDHNRIGIGASYKIGWGGDISHVQVSSQGVSLRSFIDIQVKNSWFASGGMEYNYQPAVYSLHLFRDLANWEPSGLIGVSKIISLKAKVVSSTKLSFLWDFLSYYQVPKPQPFIFRVGYTF
jgi:Skp family chaperone for outer membrane proteins